MAASLVDVRDLSVRFSSGPNVVEAVKHVSFEIAKGEIVALVGESGSGKTVSALSIMRLLPYPAASHPSGEIRFGGKDLRTAFATLSLTGKLVSFEWPRPGLKLAYLNK